MPGGDQINRLAKMRIITASRELDAQLSKKRGCSPVLEILRRLRARAAESLEALAFINAYDSEKIKLLQNEVKRYDEWVEWLRDIVSEGLEYDQQITDSEREELLDVLVQSPEGQQEAIELGLIDLNRDS